MYKHCEQGLPSLIGAKRAGKRLSRASERTQHYYYSSTSACRSITLASGTIGDLPSFLSSFLEMREQTRKMQCKQLVLLLWARKHEHSQHESRVTASLTSCFPVHSVSQPSSEWSQKQQ